MYYQNSSEIQGDGLQTLYLMNPNYAAAYPDAQHNMQFFNSAALIPHAPPLPPHSHFVGVSLPHDSTRPPPHIPAQQNTMPAAARHHYSTWGSDNPSPNTAQQQTPRGLSLSLSAHHQSGDRDFPASVGVISPKHRSSPAETNGVIVGSKYLRIAQELLDEVVNVGNHRPEKAKPTKDHPTAANREKPQTDDTGGAAAELTTAQRQEIQMKKVKLNNMLDEVEQRCRQYHQQMQMIIAAFEQAAGMGSARSYTQLALKTILRQFRCLKSTISAQIKGLNKSLGEEDSSFEGSRLKFVDHQQRAIQQLGMMQNSAAWRPQRGLPERAVSVLRAWLFQHFLHPYPKDSDKQMLAKQTGLTRSQVSNWFINARVRLWKPMVEEMYLEETKNQQHIKPEPELPDNKTPTASPPGPSLPSRTNFAQLITSLNMENLLEKNPKKPRNAVDLSPGGGHDHQTNERLIGTENYLSMAGANIDRYGIGELDQQLAAGFGHGNGFSLSLGLPPAESFLSHRSFEIESEGGRINEAGGFEMLDFQNRKPFPPQLLPDFVT